MLPLSNMNKTLSIDNQQGSRRAYNELCVTIDPSETTRRAPFSKEAIEAYLLGAIHDGTFSSNKRFRISQKGTEWLEVLQKCFAYLGYKSWIYKEGKDRKVYVLETLANFLDFNFNPLKLKKIQKKQDILEDFLTPKAVYLKIVKQVFIFS